MVSGPAAPRKMLLCKIFQRHQAQPPAQGCPQPGSEMPEPAYPMSRTAQWVAQQAQQEFQLVHRQAYQTSYQPSTVQEARQAHRRAQHASRRHRAPLTDLSSLEGPPIEDTRLLSTPRCLIPRICEEPATPNSTPHCLLWKPLPPRPASAEPSSSRLQRYRVDIPIPPTENNIGHLRNDAHLRRVPAQRNMRSLDRNETSPDRHQHPSDEHERPRSPRSHSVPHQPPGRPRRRSHSSGGLVWLEDAEQWVVAHPPASRSSHPPVTRLPTRLRNATTRPVRRYIDLSSLDVNDVGEDDTGCRGYPPDYESHAFSPTHVERLTYGPASRPRASAGTR